jgi:hypothetical protein
MRQRIRHRLDAGTKIHAPEPANVRSGRRWNELSKAYRRQQPLCERCGALAVAVHHRTQVRDDPSLTFAWDNLEAVCRTCHRHADAEAARAAQTGPGGVSRTQGTDRTSPCKTTKTDAALSGPADRPDRIIHTRSDYEGEGLSL